MAELRKELGKIKRIRFGYGGYQDAEIGLSITIEGKGWGVADFRGYWANRPERAEWTEEDQVKSLGETVLYVRDLLKQANKLDLCALEGVPLEVTFEGTSLKEWRILTEVL